MPPRGRAPRIAGDDHALPRGNAPGATADAVLVAGARTRACCAPRLDEGWTLGRGDATRPWRDTVAIIEFAHKTIERVRGSGCQQLSTGLASVGAQHSM